MKVACILIEKSTRDDNWNIKEGKDFYLRCSVQDYFIKFDESDVKKEDIAHRLNTPVTATFEIVEGYWDDCEKDRKGVYARLQELV